LRHGARVLYEREDERMTLPGLQSLLKLKLKCNNKLLQTTMSFVTIS